MVMIRDQITKRSEKTDEQLSLKARVVKASCTETMLGCLILDHASMDANADCADC